MTQPSAANAIVGTTFVVLLASRARGALAGMFDLAMSSIVSGKTHAQNVIRHQQSTIIQQAWHGVPGPASLRVDYGDPSSPPTAAARALA